MTDSIMEQDLSDIKKSLPNSLKLTSLSPVVHVHVEICQKLTSTARAEAVKSHVLNCLKEHGNVYGDFTLTEFSDSFLQEHVSRVSICDTDISFHEGQVIPLEQAQLQLHVFYLHEDGPGQEEIDDEDLAAAQHWLLPAREFHGIWENLFFDINIKGQLLQYARSTLLFSDKKVNTNVISWNRVILLHGPPGTGKTSLCKALAQKLSIQMSHRYSYGQLIEINSHSLFSKWFSESGKLVMKMFQKIQELIDDQNALVCVLIDEVESLTAARKSAMSGTEPSDAIRVVNAVLTQIDQIKRESLTLTYREPCNLHIDTMHSHPDLDVKLLRGVLIGAASFKRGRSVSGSPRSQFKILRYPNVIILTTSNVTGAIDLAFVDRADIKQYIGPLPSNAIYKIYQSSINELKRVGIIEASQQILDMRSLELMRFQENNATSLSLKLRDIAVKSHGLSGRTLRKLPFIAHAVYLQASQVSLADFIQALSKTVDRQFEERENLSKD